MGDVGTINDSLQLVAYHGHVVVERVIDCNEWRRNASAFAAEEQALLGDVRAGMARLRASGAVSGDKAEKPKVIRARGAALFKRLRRTHAKRGKP